MSGQYLREQVFQLDMAPIVCSSWDENDKSGNEEWHPFHQTIPRREGLRDAYSGIFQDYTLHPQR